MKKRVISAFMLAMINVAAICNIANLPLTAQKGLSLIFYYSFSAFLFFVPCALVAAELATGWPERGGIYRWVREALGDKASFVAIWLQWIENVIWYPTVLSFIATTFAYIINPSLAQNRVYLLITILTIYWTFTFLNFLGMKISGWISTLCVLIGTILPGCLIIFLGAIWLIKGLPSQIPLKFSHAFPSFSNFENFSILAAVLFAFSGLEMSSVHAKEVENPQKTYPKAIFLALFIILLITAFGALSIAIIVPLQNIELPSGSIEAFRHFFAAYHMSWALPLIAGLLVIGSLGLVSTWIVGPPKGLLVTARHGELPPFLQKTNKKDMPTNLLIVQACLVTLLSFVYFFMPSISSGYQMLLILTSELYILMYILMFVSAIVLRYKQPKVYRSFKIPFKNWGMWIVAGIGIFACVFSFSMSFAPPKNLSLIQSTGYVIFLIVGILLFCAIPIWIHNFRKPSWHIQKDE